MRFVIIKDKKITDKQWENLKVEFSNFVTQEAGLVPNFFMEEEDFTNVPTESDRDGDLKPTKSYTTQLMKRIHNKYGDWGTDSVVMLVHRDNWIFTGIWGTNWSNIYYQYHVHLVRFDNRNVANSLGTFYHEWMHSLDALVKTHTGYEIDNSFHGETCFYDWDTTVVHGNRTVNCGLTTYNYIRWKDNAEALQRVAPWVKKSYAKRREMYYKPLTTLQLQVIAWLRSILNKKNGVSPFITKE